LASFVSFGQNLLFHSIADRNLTQKGRSFLTEDNEGNEEDRENIQHSTLNVELAATRRFSGIERWELDVEC
jgi:hypothetical protein